MEELNFETDTNENYNLPFTISELENSLKNAYGSAAGADEVHYQLFKTFTSYFITNPVKHF